MYFRRTEVTVDTNGNVRRVLQFLYTEPASVRTSMSIALI